MKENIEFSTWRRLRMIEKRGMVGLWEDPDCPYGTRVVMALPARCALACRHAGRPGTIRAALAAAAALALIWGAF